MSNLRLPPFRIIHAAYVTGDLESGKRRLAAMFGVAEFKVHTNIPIDVPGGQATIDFAVADANGTALEVIKPAGGTDGVYRRALPADQTDIAFHHFASRVRTQSEWDMLMEGADRHDLDVPVLGASSDVKYIYLDTRTHLGHMLEFIWPSTPDAAAAFERG